MRSKIANLGVFNLMRTITLGFNLAFKKTDMACPRRLEWITNILRSITPNQPVEYVNLFINDLVPSTGWIEQITQFPWSLFEDLFCSHLQ